MTTPDVVANLAIGIIGGVIASILTLFGDRRLHRANLKRRLRQIEGDYSIVTIMPQRNTSKERVTIKHIEGCHFSVTTKNGSTGDWEGHFIVREDFSDIAQGIYRYPGSSDWGQHELLIDRQGQTISVYGINRSKPGFMDPFSYRLTKLSSKDPNNALHATSEPAPGAASLSHEG